MKLLWLRYWNALKKRAPLIGLIILLAVSTSGYMTYNKVAPQYKASTKLFVNIKPTLKPDIVINEQLADQKILKSYTEIIRSFAVGRDVVARTGVKLTPDQINAMTAVTTNTDSQVISITVTDTDEKRVVALAEEVSNAFINKVAQIMQVDNVIFLERATEKPPVTIAAKPQVNMAVAFLLSLTVGIGLTVLLEYFDPTLKTKIEVQEILGVPLIGEIGRWETVAGSGRRTAKVRKRSLLLNLFRRQAATVAEPTPLNMVPSKRNRRVLAGYEALYKNLLPLHLHKGLRTIYVTSTMRKEGKSSVLTHFGILLAQSGHRVLLIDSELESPVLHTVFQLPNHTGLCDVLTGQAALPDAAQGTVIQNLDVLPTGVVTSAGARALSSGPAFADLLQAARSRYDIVLIDGPAVAESPVPQAISPLADGVLFVVGHSKARRDHATLAVDSLRSSGAHLFGAVLNSLEGRSVASNYYLDRIDYQFSGSSHSR